LTTFRRVLLLLATVSFAAPVLAHAAGKPPVTVYAAISLTNVLDELGTQFRRATGTPVKFSYAASSVLARQLEAGAAADVFVSADREWMDYLAQRALIQPASRVDVAGNALVLVAPADGRVTLEIAPGFGLAAALGGGRLALADPSTVPAGRYAQAALTSLGVWDSVRARVAGAENVRAALAFVARGEAPLGIVYATDARAEPRVRVVGTLPPATHPPIAYPAAATANAGPEALAFVRFLASPVARATFEKYGFTTPR
jgi:molybdate transport system substrate-binding protein